MRPQTHKRGIEKFIVVEYNNITYFAFVYYTLLKVGADLYQTPAGSLYLCYITKQGKNITTEMIIKQ